MPNDPSIVMERKETTGQRFLSNREAQTFPTAPSDRALIVKYEISE